MIGGGTAQLCSQQVSWWDVHQFVDNLVEDVAVLPPPGTPAWCALEDSDPTKLIALAVAGEHHVLRVEAAQIAMAAPSREVSAAAPWSRFGKDRGPAYIRRTA